MYVQHWNVHLYTSLYLIISLSMGLGDLPPLTVTPATNSTTTIKRQLFSLPVFSPHTLNQAGVCCQFVSGESHLFSVIAGCCYSIHHTVTARGGTHTRVQHMHAHAQICAYTHIRTLYRATVQSWKASENGASPADLVLWWNNAAYWRQSLSQHAVCCDNGSTWHLVGIMASFPLH